MCGRGILFTRGWKVVLLWRVWYHCPNKGEAWGKPSLMSWGVSQLIWCPSGSSHGWTISDVMRGLTPYLMSVREQPWDKPSLMSWGVSHLIWCPSGSSHGWTISDAMRGLTPYLMSLREQPWMNHLWCHEGSYSLSDVPQGAAMDEPSLTSWGSSQLIWCPSGSSHGWTISDTMRGLTPYLMSLRKQLWGKPFLMSWEVSHLIWCPSGNSHGINHLWCHVGSHTLSDVPRGPAMDEPSLMPWRVSHLILRQWLSKHDWIHLTIPSIATVGAERTCGSKISCHVICLSMWLRRKDCAELKHA